MVWEDSAIKRIKEGGLKLTPQRMKLIEIVGRIGRNHPSLKELHEAVREEFPTMSFSTLYTNLLIMKGLGLVDFLFVDGETRLEINVKPHINLIESGKVEDFLDDELFKEIEGRVGRKVKFVNIFLD